jgi:hypothetical protein
MERKDYIIRSVYENERVRVLLGELKYTEQEMICSTWFFVSLNPMEYERLKKERLTLFIEED